MENLVCNEVFPGPVRLHDGCYHVLGHIVEVGKKLLGILRQAISSVSEGRVVVVGADSWVQAYSVDYIPGGEALGLCIGVQLIEV